MLCRREICFYQLNFVGEMSLWIRRKFVLLSNKLEQEVWEHAHKVFFSYFQLCKLAIRPYLIYVFINCVLCLVLLYSVKQSVILFQVLDITEQYNNFFLKYFFSGTAVVIHGIELRKALNLRQLIFCGSLTDEPWILNLLYQMTNFTEPYKITTWTKSIGTPFLFLANAVVVLNSPNLIKSEQIKEYIDSYHRFNHTLYLVKIAPTERGYFSHVVDRHIDATSMNYKELAEKIFLNDESK